MPGIQYVIKLSPQQCSELQTLLKGGTAKARALTHARILLKADEDWTDQEIAPARDVSVKTCERVRQRCLHL